MGGRGNASGFNWKTQLKQMAKQGKVPAAIIGDRAQQAQVFEAINKLYTMPQANVVVVEQGYGVWVNFGNSVSRVNYPSGTAASDAEKSGALKWLLHRKLTQSVKKS